MRSNQPSSSDYHSKWGITASLFMSRAFTFLGVLFFHHKKVNESFIVAKNEELTSLDVPNFFSVYPMHHDYRGGSKQKVVQIATKVKVKLLW